RSVVSSLPSTPSRLFSSAAAPAQNRCWPGDRPGAPARVCARRIAAAISGICWFSTLGPHAAPNPPPDRDLHAFSHAAPCLATVPPDANQGTRPPLPYQPNEVSCPHADWGDPYLPLT